MASDETYEITLADDLDYLTVTAEQLVHAVGTVLGSNAYGRLEDGGLHYRLGKWDLTITAEPSAILLRFAGSSTRRDRDRLTESLVRELESTRGEHLAWSTLDGSRYREDDASGEVISPPLNDG